MIAGIAIIGVLVVVLIVLELVRQFKVKKIDQNHEVINELPEMKIQEFEQELASGRELCTFDNYVIDVTKFKAEHPGGGVLIQKTIGRDVGKFIYGAYTYGPYTDY